MCVRVDEDVCGCLRVCVWGVKVGVGAEWGCVCARPGVETGRECVYHQAVPYEEQLGIQPPGEPNKS